MKHCAGKSTADTVEIAGAPLGGGVRRANRHGVRTVHQELGPRPGMTAERTGEAGGMP
ncbi:hypothetical protein ACQPZP_41440 [Spirillospora sp. CA-142024]|uniref:hypothetical protein n=1 Tax=Spirillospora sp. CA-142024 TaxID=3240036 RepID=UPI003D8E704F